MTRKLSQLFLFVFFALAVSCESSDDEFTSNGSLTINGTVVNENNSPIAGAVVTSGGKSATTGSNGQFTLNNVPSEGERSFVSVSSAESFDAYRGFVPVNGQAAQLRVMMVSKGTPINFNSVSGTSLSKEGGVVNIDPNSLRDASGNQYDGPVTAYLRFQNPEQENFGLIMQGGDFAGVNSSNQSGVLSSYGYYSIELEDAAGNELNIKQGASSSFIMPITASQIASAPSTVKLWSFDKVNGIWKEEGAATKVGSTYVGEVSHFSEWNCDDWSTTATLKGKVVCDGEPEAEVMVKVINGSNTLITHTGSNGEFALILPSGFNVTVSVSGASPVAVNAIATDAIFTLDDIERCMGGDIPSSITYGTQTFPVAAADVSCFLYSGTCSSGVYCEYWDIVGLSGTFGTHQNIRVRLWGALPTANGTYPVVPWNNGLVQDGSAAIIGVNAAVSEEYEATSGTVQVTVANGKRTVTFSNITMSKTTGGSDTITASGALTTSNCN